MHDALAVFAVRSRRNPAIALRRQQHTVTGGGKSRLLCRVSVSAGRGVPPKTIGSSDAAGSVAFAAGSTGMAGVVTTVSASGTAGEDTAGEAVFSRLTVLLESPGILSRKYHAPPARNNAHKRVASQAHDFPRDVPQRGQHGFPVRAALLPDL